MSIRALDAVTFSHIIIDDLREADGRERRGLLGGAGTYAVAGMRMVSDQVGIRSGVGADFAASYGLWYAANGIDVAGLEIRGAQTPRSWVVYQREDARTETPQFGMAHFEQMAPRMADLPRSYHQARGWYIFSDDGAEFWREIFAAQEAHGNTLLWELHEGVAQAERWPTVARIMKQVDIVSLNRAEGRTLCAVAEPRAMLARLIETGVAVVALRLGAAGALVASGSGGWHIPAYPATLQDPTGAGNAFSGALLAGLATGEELVTAACGAAAAASFMIEQYGLPSDLLTLKAEWRRRRAWLRERAILLH